MVLQLQTELQKANLSNILGETKKRLIQNNCS